MTISSPLSRTLKRGLLACSAVAVLAVASPVLAQASGGQSIAFAIEGQALETALTSFARTADVQVVFSPELVRGKRAGRVVGLMPPAQALREILAGSGLVATQVGERTFSVSQIGGPSEPQPPTSPPSTK